MKYSVASCSHGVPYGEPCDDCGPVVIQKPRTVSPNAADPSQREADLALAKSLVQAWLMEKGIALTGVNGEASKSTVHRFKLDLAARILTALTTARKEASAAAFKSLQQQVDNLRAACDCGNLDPRDVDRLIEAAANTEEREGNETNKS